jgi:phage baseplate assembly protein gpV
LEERCLLATVNWVNPAGGAWEVVGNWRDDLNVNRLPTAADDVCIDQPGSIVITHSSGDHTIHSLTSKESLTISGGSLALGAASEIDADLTLSGSGSISGAGDLTVSGTLHWSGGTMKGSGSTVLAAGGTLTMDGTGTKYLDGRTLTVDGTANWTGGWIRMSGATINNNGSWTANSNSTLQMSGGSVAGNAFNNNATGTFTQQGTGTTQFTTYLTGVAFNNAGTVNVSQGTLQSSCGGTHSAAINVSDGAAVTINVCCGRFAERPRDGQFLRHGDHRRPRPGLRRPEHQFRHAERRGRPDGHTNGELDGRDNCDGRHDGDRGRGHAERLGQQLELPAGGAGKRRHNQLDGRRHPVVWRDDQQQWIVDGQQQLDAPDVGRQRRRERLQQQRQRHVHQGRDRHDAVYHLQYRRGLQQCGHRQRQPGHAAVVLRRHRQRGDQRQRRRGRDHQQR